MTISTKGRYALRIMVDLASNYDGSYIPLKTVAERQGLSQKYLEHIFRILVQNHVVEGVQGKGGGYCLTRKPEEYTVGEILRMSEGEFAASSCLECHSKTCEHTYQCRTDLMWKNLQGVIDGYLDSITIKDLISVDNFQKKWYHYTNLSDS